MLSISAAKIILHVTVKNEEYNVGNFESSLFSLNNFYLKLRNIILLLTRGLFCIFSKWLYSQRCFHVVQGC